MPKGWRFGLRYPKARILPGIEHPEMKGMEPRIVHRSRNRRLVETRSRRRSQANSLPSISKPFCAAMRLFRRPSRVDTFLSKRARALWFGNSRNTRATRLPTSASFSAASKHGPFPNICIPGGHPKSPSRGHWPLQIPPPLIGRAAM